MHVRMLKLKEFGQGKYLFVISLCYIIIWYTSTEEDCCTLVVKGTNGRQKTYEIFHVYCIFYSGFMCQTTVIFGITKDGGLAFYPLAS